MNIDGEFYLCDSVGRQVLNADGEPVLLSVNGEDEGEEIDVAGIIGILKSQYRMGWMSWATMFMAYQTKMVKYIHRPT